MANTFTRKLSRNVGTSGAAVGSYTVASSTVAIVVGMTITNTTGSSLTANVYINAGGANTYISSNAPIASGSSLIVGGGDQKIVLVTGDTVYVNSSAASSLDVVMSILEIT